MTDRLAYIERESRECVCGCDIGPSWTWPDRHGIKTPMRVCRDCGLLRTDPRPTAASLERFYREDYRAMFDKDGPEALYEQERRTGFAIKSLGLIVPGAKGARMLDYGCGAGGSLAAFDDVFETTGVEPGEYAAFGRKKGHVIYADSKSLPSGHYDLILAIHTIEHRHDLAEALEEHRRLLAPGGKLVIEVPTLEMISATHYKTLSAYLQLPHLWHFSQATLEHTLRRAGLLVVCKLGPGAVVCERAASVVDGDTRLEGEQLRTCALLGRLTEAPTPAPSTHWADDLGEDDLRENIKAIEASRLATRVAIEDMITDLRTDAEGIIKTMGHAPNSAQIYQSLCNTITRLRDIATIADAAAKENVS